MVGVEGGTQRPYFIKKTTREGVKNHRFWDDIVYGRPLSRVGRQAKDKILIIKINFYQGYQLEQINHPYNPFIWLNCGPSATLFLKIKVCMYLIWKKYDYKKKSGVSIWHLFGYLNLNSKIWKTLRIRNLQILISHWNESIIVLLFEFLLLIEQDMYFLLPLVFSITIFTSKDNLNKILTSLFKRIISTNWWFN